MAEVTPLTLDDYDAIADAVQETERGRWFLAEFARRNRAADTAMVLQALGELERRLAARDPVQPSPPPRAVELIHAAMDCALRARTAESKEASRRFDDLERILALAAEALGAKTLGSDTLGSKTPPRRDARGEVEPVTPTVAPTPLALAAPAIAYEPEQTPEPKPVKVARARPNLLLDSLTEAERAILFA